MEATWKFLFDSVAGTSHAADESGCQDASFVTPYAAAGDGGSVLIAVCSDGAGSAQHAAAGSALACRVVGEQVCDFLDNGGDLATADEAIVRGWVQAVHEHLLADAERLDAKPRDFACTLLLAVVGATHAAFAQVGDGAIVIRDGEALRPVFWPQNGEYQNTTFFLTDLAYAVNVQIAVTEVRVDELAMLTDGLQALALKLSTKTAHGPFFEPLLRALREQHQDDLVLPMRQFLDSPAVNERTDDDKTLILATRATDRVHALA